MEWNGWTSIFIGQQANHHLSRRRSVYNAPGPAVPLVLRGPWKLGHLDSVVGFCFNSGAHFRELSVRGLADWAD